MKILHLASGNRWTGAAAPAFGEVVALREAGVDAHYAYVGGYKLQAKIGRMDFTHPIIRKAQNPISFFGSADALGRLIDHHGFDMVHAHLTWDHVLARFAAGSRRLPVARTFHARRVIRSDPFTRLLIAKSDLICVTNPALRDATAIRQRDPLFTPPPIDLQEFTPEGPDVRERYQIDGDAAVIAVIGKLSRDRGFELALQTFALIRQRIENARLMIIGHGEHRGALEALASALGIAAHIVWAGYHEDDLAEHYRAADVLLFTASGSEEGHRAVLEAMACGVIPVTVPLDGIGSLLSDLAGQLIASEGSAVSLAETVVAVLGADLSPEHLWQQSQQFSYRAAAERLIRAYRQHL